MRSLISLGIPRSAAKTVLQTFLYLLCLFGFLFLIFILTEIRARQKSQTRFLLRFGEYEATVRKIIPNLEPGEHWARFEMFETVDLNHRIFARKESDGTVTITFFTGGSFPVHHFGVAYSSDDDEGAVSERLRANVKRIRQYWFQWSSAQ